MLHALVYRHFREEPKHAGFPGGVQEDLLCPCPPLRLLVFCFSAWDAAEQHLSLLWLATLNPQPDGMA